MTVDTHVIFLAAPWYSGSTLLGLMLGAAPSVLYCGEAMCASSVGDASAPPHLRSCRICGPDCPIWGSWPRSRDRRLYAHLFRTSGKSTVFDSSKSRTWVEQQSKELAGSTKTSLIVLSRDGRAVVNSFIRKNPSADFCRVCQAWMDKVHKVEQTACHWRGQTYRLSYERLVAEPVAEMTTLCSALGIEFVEQMCNPWRCDPHPLDSNPGPLLMMLNSQGRRSLTGVLDATPSTQNYYVDQPPRLAADVRWLTEMTPDQLAVFEAVCGATNKMYM